MASDDEMDAELLALAEGSSDDEVDAEDEALDTTQHFNDRSPSPDVKPSVEKAEETGVRRGVAQKVRAKRGRRARRKDDSDDEDDGAFASSPESPDVDQPRSLSAEDAAGSPIGESDEPLYPIEGKFMSQADREWLASLPELEREQELEKRAQEQIRRQQDMQLKRALANNRSTTKRKAEDDLEESRKSSRPKMERGAKSALDKYKKLREEAGEKRERGARKPSRRDRSASEDSQRDADGESEVEWADSGRRRPEQPPADIADYNRCRVGRSNFAQICFYPGFEEAITGCFARVSVGPNRDTGENMYRMALIKGFKEGKPYQMEGANGKKFLTDQYAVVAQGKSEKSWPFAACSDGKFTNSELGRYLDTLKEQRLRIPTRMTLEGKINDINALLNRRWTDEEITEKIKRQKDIEKKYDPANAANLARQKIEQRKKIAEDEEDFEELARCNAELQALDIHSTNGASVRAPIASRTQKSGHMTEQDRLAARNAATRKANTEEVRKALLEERRQEIAARERAIAELRAKEAALKVPATGNDAELFGEVSDISRAGTPLNGAKKKKLANGSRAGTPSSQGGAKQPLGALRSGRMNDDEIIGAMDLDIDVEI